MNWAAIVKTLNSDDLADLESALAASRGRSPSAAQWIWPWFSEVYSKRIASKTIASYRTRIKQYIVPAIGHVPLHDVAPQHVREVEAYIRDKGLGGGSAEQAHRVLSVALRDAMRDGRISRNVATLVDQPKKKPRRSPSSTLLVGSGCSNRAA